MNLNVEQVKQVQIVFKKYLKKQGKEITVPEAGTEFRLGNAKCKILGLNVGRNDDPNNTSIVLKVQYGDTAFLFSGDAEQSVEKSIIEDGYNISCTVMKIPHHGSDTSLSWEQTQELHAGSWTSQGGNVDPYYRLRRNVMDGMLSACGLKLSMADKDHYMLEVA